MYCLICTQHLHVQAYEYAIGLPGKNNNFKPWNGRRYMDSIFFENVLLI